MNKVGPQERYEQAYVRSYDQTFHHEKNPWLGHSHRKDCDLCTEIDKIKKTKNILKSYNPPTEFFNGLFLFFHDEQVDYAKPLKRLREGDLKRDPESCGNKRGRQDANARLRYLGWKYGPKHACKLGLCSHKDRYCGNPCYK